MRLYLRIDLALSETERFNTNTNAVIAPLSSAADDCFPRAQLQPPRKKTTSCGVFRHVLFPQDKEGTGSIYIARRKLVCIFEERSEEHTSELQSRGHLVCRLLLEKKKSK